MENSDTNPLMKPESRLNFSFSGSATDLLLLVVKNIFLTAITLGIYFPWARTEIRKYLWEHTFLGKQNFRYTGTGKELFFGYLKVFLIYLAFIALSQLSKSNAAGQYLFLIFIFLIMIFGIPLIIWGGYAYRLSRTQYRGFSFSVDPQKKKDFLKEAFIKLFLVYITFGIYTPFYLHFIYENLTNSTKFGDKKFNYTGNASDFFWIVFSNIFLTIITFGIFYPWAFIRTLNYRLNNIRFGEARIETQITGGQFLGVILLQLILVPLTLGLAFPFVQVLTLRVFLNQMKLEGVIDFKKISASENNTSSTGDAASSVFDVDVF